MKKSAAKLAFVVLVIGMNGQVFGFAGDTHATLTSTSASGSVLNEYLKTYLDVQEGLSCVLTIDQSAIPPGTRIPLEQLEDRMSSVLPANPTILDFLECGARLEDVPATRARHHFHDPYRDTGLENKTEHPDWAVVFSTMSGFDLTGASALRRALGSEDPNWESEYENYFAWPDSRGYFHKGLVEQSLAVREHYLALTFLSLGHVSHLLEDAGVPAHARNDFIEAHFRVPKGLWKNPLESHIEEAIGTSGIPERWLEDWVPQTQAFPKLADYWDGNDYGGQHVGTSPLSYWGLSEQTNYQFLSKSTIFRKNDGTKYYFPHPDVNNVTEHIDEDVYLWGLVSVDYKYVSGYDITHLARTKFIEKYTYIGGMAYPTGSVPYHTTFDGAVYEDYAKATMPRTIDYATGLINYFFRGRLDVRRGSADPNIVTELVITNTSDNSGIPQALKGGAFEIYRDDANETRTEIPPGDITFMPAWTEASVLPNDAGATELIAQFTPPAEEARNYIVVYRGGISELPEDPDPDDPNAIAVGILRGGYEVFAWTDEPDIGDKYGQVSDAPEGADFVDIAAGKRHCLALGTDGSIEAWGRDNYGQVSGKPAGNDFVAIAAGANHSLALDSGGSIVVWGDDALWQITGKPSGSDFVAIAAGEFHSLALKSDGTIVGWGGYNTYGECDAPAPDGGTVYTVVAAGTYHSLALQSDGRVKAWGDNGLGQTRIYDGAGGQVHLAIATCFNYNLLLRDDGVLISWGGGDWLEPGIPRYHYRQADGTEFVALAAGWDHLLALTSAGAILAWDWPEGALPFDYFLRTVPQGIVFTDAVAAGNRFGLALKAP